jgi:hypothetical protein
MRPSVTVSIADDKIGIRNIRRRVSLAVSDTSCGRTSLGIGRSNTSSKVKAMGGSSIGIR